MKPFDYHIRSWKYGAIWTWSGQPRWYSTYCVIVWLALYISTPILQFWNMWNATNIFDLVDAIYVLPATLLGIKIALLWKNKPNIIRFFKLSDRMESDLIGDEFKNIYQQSELKILRIIRSVAFLYTLTLLLTFVDAQFAGKHQLMWNFKMPYEIDGLELIYQCTICAQLVLLMICVVITSSLDCFCCTFYALLATHLDILICKLQALDKTINNWTKTESTKPADRLPQQHKNVLQLKKCIKFHCICNQLCYYSEQITSNYNILQFGLSSIALCFSFFHVYFYLVC